MRVYTKYFFLLAVFLFFLGALKILAADWPTPPTGADLAADAGLRAEIDTEWEKSHSGDKDQRHEEGGWIVQCRTWNEQTQQYEYALSISSVPSGSKAGLSPGAPPELGADCRIVGFKHTHPNPPTDEDGVAWDQGPSDADKGWHERHGIPGIVRNAGGSVVFGPESGTYK
jgi:hypothetical protein